MPINTQINASTVTELREDLKRCVNNTGLFPMFEHELFVSLYSEDMNAMINAFIPKRLALLEQLDSFEEQIHFIERKFQFEYLIKHFERFSLLDSKTQWDIIDYVWTNCEFPHSNLSVWNSIFMFTDQSPFFNSIEYEKMDEEITIYRGGLANGLSWTGNKEQAIWFANRFKHSDHEPQVWQLTINKHDIYHYTDSRGEDEFIIDPELAKKAVRII
ncbi:TPA: hypothetical protein ACX6RO_001837 [Photobacterium damselae]